MTLETIEIETAPKPNAAMIWLHGLGADGHDFEPVVPELVRRGERAWRFVFPHATPRSITINGGMHMRAWYDIVGFDRNAEEDEAGFRESDAAVRGLIAREVGRGIAASRIVLAGFSQGGAVSLYTALVIRSVWPASWPSLPTCPWRARLAAEQAAANRGTPIFMAHGLSDPVLPIAMGLESRDFLKTLGYAIEWHQYPMPHSLCEDEIGDIRAFLHRVLP